MRTFARDLRYLRRIRRFRSAMQIHDWTSACEIWSNPSSANPRLLEHLEVVIRDLAASELSILECGSGLSTLLMGSLSHELSFSHRSFESSARWARKTRLKAFIAGVEVNVEQKKIARLGNFDWYRLGENDLLTSYNLVLCDGPPSNTFGGRYGLLPTLKEQLRGAVIILDDAGRESERRILEQWRVEFGVIYEVFSPPDEKAYAIALIPEMFPDEMSVRIDY